MTRELLQPLAGPLRMLLTGSVVFYITRYMDRRGRAKDLEGPNPSKDEARK